MIYLLFKSSDQIFQNEGVLGYFCEKRICGDSLWGFLLPEIITTKVTINETRKHLLQDTG